jgi:hypothetical protein
MNVVAPETSAVDEEVTRICGTSHPTVRRIIEQRGGVAVWQA